MKIRNVIMATLLGVFLPVTVAIAVAQTRARPAAPPIATAQIPFDFWIGDTHLPAGEYVLYPVLRLNTLVLLQNTKTDAAEQAFLVPTGDPVGSGDHKLVFLEHAGQHYLRELWDADGKAILTLQVGTSVGPVDTRNDVPLVDQRAANTVTAAK